MGGVHCLIPQSPCDGQGFQTAAKRQHTCMLFEVEIGFTVTADLSDILSRTVGIENCFLPLKGHCFAWLLHITPKFCPGWGRGEWGERRISGRFFQPFQTTVPHSFFVGVNLILSGLSAILCIRKPQHISLSIPTHLLLRVRYLVVEPPRAGSLSGYSLWGNDFSF